MTVLLAETVKIIETVHLEDTGKITEMEEKVEGATEVKVDLVTVKLLTVSLIEIMRTVFLLVTYHSTVIGAN